MEARLFPRSMMNAVALVNPSTLPYIRSLTLEGRYGSASTSADGVPIYRPPEGKVSEGNYGTLLGYPIIPCEYTKAVGTAGDIVLADLSQYLLIDKAGIESAESIHVRFAYGESTFRAFYRVDGAPWWQAALTPYDAGDTLSPFVKLAVRE
jgi:HK97 family phage major capsid protein